MNNMELIFDGITEEDIREELFSGIALAIRLIAINRRLAVTAEVATAEELDKYISDTKSDMFQKYIEMDNNDLIGEMMMDICLRGAASSENKM